MIIAVTNQKGGVGKSTTVINLAAGSGKMELYLNGTLLETLSNLDNDALTIDSVRLGAMNVTTTNVDTLYFDDYKSTRLSYIGTLENPGSSGNTTTPATGMANKAYTYTDFAHKNAVTGVTVTDANNNTTQNTYKYDANGSGLCTPELHLREGQHDLP